MSQPLTSRPFTKVVHKEAYDAISSSQPSLSVKGKTILITGGTEGIGFAIVKAFAGAGASDIIIVARRPELLEEAKKGIEQAHPSTKVHTFPASIDDAEKAKSIFAQVREKIAEPDVVVFNAASGHAPTPTLELPVDKLWQDFEVNVGGHMNFLREYLRPTTSSKERIIINVSTLAAHAPVQGMASYGASKEAFVHLLSHVQLEYADKNVRIVSYHPGGIITSSAKRLGFDKYPIPWDNVNLPGQFALWLASKEAAFLAGRFVYASWDVDELKARAGEIEKSDLLKIGLIVEPAV